MNGTPEKFRTRNTTENEKKSRRPSGNEMREEKSEMRKNGKNEW